MLALIKHYEDRYGKLTYGFATFVLAWYVFVQPMQQAAVTVASKNAEATGNLRECMASAERMQTQWSAHR